MLAALSVQMAATLGIWNSAAIVSYGLRDFFPCVPILHDSCGQHLGLLLPLSCDELGSDCDVALIGMVCPEVSGAAHWTPSNLLQQLSMPFLVDFVHIGCEGHPSGQHKVEEAAIVPETNAIHNGDGPDVHSPHPGQGPPQLPSFLLPKWPLELGGGLGHLEQSLLNRYTWD